MSEARPNARWLRHSHIWAPIFIGLLAASVSVARSGVPGLWRDEVSTQVMVTRPLDELWRSLGSIDAVHGGYYLLMKAWLMAAGEASPLSLRLPSAIMVGLAAALVVVLGRRLASLWAGVLAGLVFLALPRVTWMGAEARSAALATALVTLSVLLWLIAMGRSARASRNGEALAWVSFAGAAGASVAVYIYAALALLALPLAMLVARSPRRTWIWFLGATGLGALVAAPVLLRVPAQQSQVAWIQRPTLATLAELPRDVWFPGDDYLILVAWLVVALAVAGLWLALAKAARPEPAGTRECVGALGFGVLLLGWTLLPVVLLVGYSFVGTPMYVARYLAITAPGLALSLGIGLAGMRPRWAGALATLVIVALGAQPWWQSRQVDSKSPTYSVASYVGRQDTTHAAVLFETLGPTGGSTRIAQLAYPEDFAGLPDLNLGSGPASNRIWAAEVPLSSVPARLDGIRRVWLVGYVRPLAAARADIATLWSHGFRPKSTRSFTSGWIVVLYER